MAGVTQSQAELLAHLRDQLLFLRQSSEAFDAGHTAEAKRIATAVRVLVHDTSSSKSLLGQLRLKEIPFRDTARPYESGNMLGSQSLLYMLMSMDPSGVASVKYKVPLDERNPGRRIAFREWWDQVILGDGTGLTLSRKELILTLADQDGGAHVDPALEAKYAAFARGKAGAWVAEQTDGTRQAAELAERFSARQIAHEVLVTLEPYG